MNIINSENPDAIQLLSDDETKTLTLALLEGPGGWLEAEERDAAMERFFAWANRVCLESKALEYILRGKLMVRCEPDGEISVVPKSAETYGSLH